MYNSFGFNTTNSTHFQNDLGQYSLPTMHHFSGNMAYICNPVRLFCLHLYFFLDPKRWCCESAALNMPANLKNSAVATGLEKVNFHFNPKERQCKECLNYHTIALISHASKVMLKILQAKLKHYVNHELPDIQTGFRKGRGTRNQNATSVTS